MIKKFIAKRHISIGQNTQNSHDREIESHSIDNMIIQN